MSKLKTKKPKIVLTTANSRFSHTSMGLRYLRANLKEFRDNSVILEFNLQSRAIDVVEKILNEKPDIVGLGVYIWNITLVTEIVSLIKIISPNTIIILGGPEISYETREQAIFNESNYVITGWGETSFYQLVSDMVNGIPQLEKIIFGKQPPLTNVVMPYHEYTDIDIAHRTVYVEASRGCPFKCEFCLSSLDKAAYPFPLLNFLTELETLYQRGLRIFKFVDRTFNIKAQTGRQILDFFLDKIEQNPDDKIFVHLEVIPDHLPELIKEAIKKFPKQSLQLELGLQTLDLETQKVISRKTNLNKAKENIIWLCSETNAHLHVDLIAGLPGENLISFGKGFDELHSWQPHEIQLGILKRLRGTPIIRHTENFSMKYNPLSPYQVLSTGDISFEEMQKFTRFARYWDMVANSGRFKNTINYLMQTNQSAYQAFMNFVDFAYSQLNATHKISYENLWNTVHKWLLQNYPAIEKELIEETMLCDYKSTGMKGNPFNKINKIDNSNTTENKYSNKNKQTPSRQQRH